MLYLSNSGPTRVVVTLYENCSNITNPYFTWKLVNKDTLAETIFTQLDFSSVPYYFNYFTISVATYSGLTAGIIDVPAGQYQYYVYEMANPYDLDLQNAVGLVENGILNVGAIFSTQSIFTASNTNTIPTFMGGL
jgi:hypothetical protein